MMDDHCCATFVLYRNPFCLGFFTDEIVLAMNTKEYTKPGHFEIAGVHLMIHHLPLIEMTAITPKRTTNDRKGYGAADQEMVRVGRTLGMGITM